MAWWSELQADLAELEGLNLRRHLRPLQLHPSDFSLVTSPDGQQLINFSSNDYLGLRRHKAVVAAARQATDEYGTGAGASRLITGSTPLHEELEAALARFKSTEAALVFSSGYMASLGLFQVLSRRTLPVFFDKLSHACIVDGATGRNGNWRSFPHNDIHGLEQLLRKLPVASGSSYQAVVVTEGVFSMDGDLAPLPDLLELAEKYGAVLVVDDAHGSGTLGPLGMGAAAYWNVSGHPRLVHLGTLSKALGSQGGFVAGPQALIDLMVSRARPFVFDTALAPASVAAALKALEVLQSEPVHLEQLEQNSSYSKDLLRGRGLSVTSKSGIVPIHLGSAAAALQAADDLRDSGFLVVAIRPPTVPRGTSRLRIALSSVHSADQLQSLAAALPVQYSQ